MPTRTRTTADCQRERCGHSADDHIVAHDDSNEAAWDRMCDGDELAHVRFECCWPIKHELMGARVLCDCKDYIPSLPREPSHAH